MDDVLLNVIVVLRSVVIVIIEVFKLLSKILGNDLIVYKRIRIVADIRNEDTVLNNEH